MPRVCTICTHPKRGEIDRALLAEEPYRTIADRWSVSKTALLRHKEAAHMVAHLVKAHEATEISNADHLTAELKRVMERVNLLFDACDRWLRDPDNPEQYDINPRAEDVKVTYLEPIGDKVIRRKACLSDLLPKIERHGLEVQLIEVKHADPRKLLLETSERLEGHLTLLAKLLGELKEGQTVNILMMPEWQRMRTVMVEALTPYPEAKIAVAAALWRLEHANGHEVKQ